MIRSRITGTGAYLPSRIVTNHELAQRIDTNHDWIVERTGIHQRHIAAEGEFTSDLAAAAARHAIANAGIAPETIDMIILATETPDDTMPSCAATTQHKLGLSQCPSFDIHAACSGFLYALSLADNTIRAGQARTILVIGAETFSRIVDWNDRGTCILFGDGAGAAILQAEEGTHGVYSTRLFADGSHGKILATDGGISRTQKAGFIHMEGKEVFKHAVQKMTDALQQVLQAENLTSSDLDWLVPHQANRRIIEAIGTRLPIAAEKVIMTLDQHANTSAASIPLALHHAVSAGKIKPGQWVALQALGAGLTWGACLIKW